MALPDDSLQIQTPENVVFGYQIAGIGSRFLAAVVDSLLMLILPLLLSLILALLVSNLSSAQTERLSQLSAWLLGLGGLLAFGLFWGYYIFFEMLWNGQSPGKRLAGLRVIRSDGAPISLSESIIRNLVRLVDFLPAYYGVGVIAMFLDPQSRRLGDMAAGTLVVFDRARVSLESLEKEARARPAAADLQRLETSWPVERLAPSDVRMAEDFLRRREELFNRQELAEQIVHSLLERMGVAEQANSGLEPEEQIEEIVRAYRGRE